MTNTTTTPAELTALLAAFDAIEPWALTACPGWTAHHVAAHIGGNYEEIRRHVEAFADGDPLERTQSWEEREQPLRELHHATLLRHVEEQAMATTRVLVDVLSEHPDAELRWTNRTVPISGFLTHLRSEDALHRWDLVGDDDTSAELLSQEELLVHAVEFIGKPLLQRGLGAGGGKEPFTARVRCVGRDDLVVDVSDGAILLSVSPPEGSAAIEGDPAARLLLLWGRKPSPFFRLHSAGGDEGAARVQALLLGY